MHNVKDIYVTGDIHGEFKTLVFVLIESKKLRDCAVIVAGDIGMGFYKHMHYVDLFNKLNKKLCERNIHLYFVRGNHDNPRYFNKTPENLSNISHIHFVHDYDVLKLCGHNILCVGGATSVDKAYRKENVTWWDFEYVLPYEKLNCKDVDIVVTHCAPMFCPPKHERLADMTIDIDEHVCADRNTLSKLYFDLVKTRNFPEKWFYGHYHKHYESKLDNNYEFTDVEQFYLNNGLEDIEIGNSYCEFIGLGILEKNTIDIYKI